MEKKRLNRQQMADRLAQEFQDGWLVNLGIGIPTLCSNYSQGDKEIIYHSENGVIGYGSIYPRGEEDLQLVNAGGQYVSLVPGASIVHHADSFAIIRGGMLDLTVMGAYEVAENGDFANWKTEGRKGGEPWTWPWGPNECTSPCNTPPETASPDYLNGARCPLQPRAW